MGMQGAGYVWPNGHVMDNVRWMSQGVTRCAICGIHADSLTLGPCGKMEDMPLAEDVISYNLRSMLQLPKDMEFLLAHYIRDNRRFALADVLNRPEYEPGFWVNPGL